MPRAKRPKTVGALRKSNYQVLPVRQEMRKNLIAKIRAEEIVFPGIVGFENTVIPQIENAIVSWLLYTNVDLVHNELLQL